jgi:hypothetical protein
LISIGTGALLGFAAAFGIIVPVLRPQPVVAAAPASDTPSPDFGPYQTLLDEYLVVTSAKGRPLQTRFDYERLHLSRGRYERFARVRKAMFAVPPATMDDVTRLAWAINAYNFLVIENATNNLIVPRRGMLRYTSVKEMSTGEGTFFTRPVVEIAGTRYSLDTFERTFVFPGYTPAPGTSPPAGFDPRPHFALVCGASGCPPLQPLVYDPRRIDAQLDAAVTGALQSPSHLVWKAAERELLASSIFDWYVLDFGGHAGAFQFLVRHAPASVRSGIAKQGVTSVTGYVPWDWDLNQVPRKTGG